MTRKLRDRVDDEQNSEANMFAAHLLVPSKFLNEEVRKLGGVDLIDGDKTSILANHFQVSESLITLRLLEEFRGIHVW